MSREITREELSAAGVQYGHQTKRWNPKMKSYIYGVKNKNHIIDLEKTITHLNTAQKLLETLGSKQQKILFVGTKRSGKNAVKEAALRSGNFYINNRWLGGTLTNLKTILIRIKALWEIEEEEKKGRLSLRTKKEQIKILKEKTKLEKALGGIKQMHKLPAAIVVVDPKGDEIAVKEAKKLNIPVIAICDTNADPDMIDYVIPGNDDLQESVNLIINILVEAYAEGAQIKMNPSVLKTVVPKREPRQNRVMTPVVENQSTEQQASENVSNTQVSNEPITPVVEVEKSSEPKAE
ncbi:30S ribosomal protein S2 [Mycoplasma mycoides subsp. mycoides]|uniref:Small ribosomal subunit protein uS2 n=1 Tax=Mycoplasma mycoides subsp. mycoides TaxID=2103 RepID=A0AAE2JTD0_MYCMY|nr:30S ribosomal protein S2 [Mycoplasma mycoides]ADK69528.1 ribosomal protein S2 [Mycoplasma mycoides subsp. mycoides SC str. Gladysdale]AIZ55466.1 Vegetative protein 209 [Mycoplasma mycoides subsp. mycoides]AME10814.1 ribosomal protein S2 [Mycoplasma mycoides subsp. mycoides]AME11822.1 ribosomal protein S2 [Mycoplasma mycoides subsp. mycoides]AME12852.1 ribosomal protein S2 [Mycoplasma mycoides subsp. mycoides]